MGVRLGESSVSALFISLSLWWFRISDIRTIVITAQGKTRYKESNEDERIALLKSATVTQKIAQYYALYE